MGLNKKGDLEYVTFSNLEKTGLVNHCFTTRNGGVSEGVYKSLNMSTTRGDKLEAVMENYKILSDILGFDNESFFTTRQTHTTNIRHVTEKDRNISAEKKREIQDIDGLITNISGINLTIFGADCVPIFFLAPLNKVIGVAHAGWRGTVDGIAAKIVKEMKKHYNVDPKDLLVGIGPSIGRCCFQVDMPVVEIFEEKWDFSKDVIFDDPSESGKYKVDLWEMNQKILMSVGVLKQNIEISNLCTMCHENLFYSHRKMGNERGNMAGIMTLL